MQVIVLWDASRLPRHDREASGAATMERVFRATTVATSTLIAQISQMSNSAKVSSAAVMERGAYRSPGRTMVGLTA